MGEKVFLGDQDQILLIPAAHALQKVLLLLGKVGEEPPLDHLRRLVHQVAYGLIVQIEGGAVDPGPLADLLHGDVLQILLIQQGDEGFVQAQGGIEVFALGPVHQPSSFSLTPPLR